MRSLRRQVAKSVSVCLVVSGPLKSQVPSNPVQVAVGFAVDTTSPANHEIFGIWSHYLRSRPSCTSPSPEWSGGDLLCSQVYQGFTSFTVASLEPAAGMDSTYLIRTLVGSLGDSAYSFIPLALYRTYAIREHGRWVLTNALPLETRTWKHERIGRVTFVFQPTHAFVRTKAEGSARFVDSLATAWSLTPPDSVGYYFTDNPKDTQRAMGLDYIPAPDTAWGLADTQHKMVFVGSSRSGEDYRHELAHLVLIPFTRAHPPARLVNEGLATWTGGSAGLRFRELMPALRRYLEAHTDLTLEQIMADAPRREGSLDVGYDGFAALCELVYAKSGLPGITALADAGRDPKAVLAAAAKAVGVPTEGLDQAWRARVRELSK